VRDTVVVTVNVMCLVLVTEGVPVAFADLIVGLTEPVLVCWGDRIVRVTEGVLVCWGERIVRDTVVVTVNVNCLALVTELDVVGLAV
jgi:hypothetical protein